MNSTFIRTTLARFPRLASFLRLQTSKDVIINTGGNYIGFLLAGVYTLLFVRVFTPEEFGVLSVLLVLSYLLANIFSFGMPASIYANIPKLLSDRERVFQFIKTNFLFMTGLAGVSLFAIMLLSGYIDKYVLKLEAPPKYYAVALIGSLLYIWQNYVRDVLNAAQKFFHINVAMNSASVLRVVILTALAVIGKLNILTVLITMGIVGPMTVFFIVILKRQWIVKSFLNSKVQREHIKIAYTMTYFVSTQVYNLATRVDLFMVAYFLSSTEVGYYGLSQRIILAVLTSVDSITQVFSPRFAKIGERKNMMRKTEEGNNAISQAEERGRAVMQVGERSEIIKLLKQAYIYMLIPTACFVAGIILPTSIYNAVFTSAYAPGIVVTRLLSAAYIPFSFAAVTVLYFLYTVKKPAILLKCNIIMLVIIAVGNYVLIPKLGLLGPPLVFTVAFGVVIAYIAVRFRSTLNRSNYFSSQQAERSIS